MKEYKILREVEESRVPNSLRKLEIEINKAAADGWDVRFFGASHASAGDNLPYYISTVFYALLEREIPKPK